jgi:hypothetical protein
MSIHQNNDNNNDDTSTNTSRMRTTRLRKTGYIADRLLAMALGKISEWASEWRVEWGYDKCNVLPFTRMRTFHTDRLPPFILNGRALAIVDRYKYLGLWFSRALDWNHHSEYIIQRLNTIARRITAIIRPRTPPRVPVIRLFVNAKMLTVIQYGLHVWQPHTVDQCRRIQSSYARVLTMALGLSLSAHHLSVLAECGVCDVRSLQYRAVVAFFDSVRRRKDDHPLRPIIADHLSKWQRGPINGTMLRDAVRALFHPNEIKANLDAQRISQSPTIDNVIPHLAGSGTRSLSARTLSHSFNEWAGSDGGRLYRHARMGEGKGASSPAKAGMAEYLKIGSRGASIMCARMRLDRNNTADSLYRRGSMHNNRCKRCNGISAINDDNQPIDNDGVLIRGDKLKTINNALRRIAHPIDDITHFVYHCLHPSLIIIRLKHNITVLTMDYHSMLASPSTTMGRERYNAIQRCLAFYDDVNQTCPI